MTNRFAVPGLFVPGSAAEGASGWRAVTLPARSAGAWSDSLTVGVALEVTTSLPVIVGPQSLVLEDATDVVAGDLLRVVLTDDVALLVEVDDVEPDPRGRMIVFDPRQGYLLTWRRPAKGATAYRLGDGPPEQVPSFTTDVVAGEDLVVVAAAEPVGQADVLLTESRADEGVTVLTLGEEQPHGASPGTRRFAVRSSVGVSGARDDWPSLGDSGATPVVAEIPAPAANRQGRGRGGGGTAVPGGKRGPSALAGRPARRQPGLHGARRDPYVRRGKPSRTVRRIAP